MQNMDIIYQSINLQSYLMYNCYKTGSSQAQSAYNMHDCEWR